MNRAGDWFKQAERDLEHAEAFRRDGRHEWAVLMPAGTRFSRMM